MISTLDHELQVHGNLEVAASDSRFMGIHEEALSAITDSMINLYTDKALAVVREYSTNAYDAIRAAGKSDPVVVQLPGTFDKRLIVRDNGIGMTRDEVLNFYSQYGASDKRNSNTQVGTFGFGCKAAFTVSDQFQVTAVKNGWKTVALFSRDEKGVGTARIISHDATDDEPGVEVVVPVSDIHAITDAAKRFFYYWPKGSVLVDDEQPRSFQDSGTRIAGATFAERRGYSPGRISVLMGNVAYPVGNTDAFHGWNTWNREVLIGAEIGEVDIVPSREGLRDTEKTKAFLKRRATEIKQAVIAQVEADLAEAKTLYEAACIHRKTQDHRSEYHAVGGSRMPVQWRGQKVSTSLRIELPTISVHDGKTTLATYGTYLDVGTLDGVLVATGDVAINRRGLAQLMQQMDKRVVMLCRSGDFKLEWFEVGKKTTKGLDVMTVEDLDEKRRNLLKQNRKTPAPRQQGEATYSVYVKCSQYHWSSACESCTEEIAPADLAASTAPVAYTGPFNDDKANALSWLQSCVENESPIRIVALRRGQSEDALLKRVPQAVPVVSLVNQMMEEAIKKITKHDLAVFRAQNLGWRNREFAKTLLPYVKEIHDKGVRKAIRDEAAIDLSTQYKYDNPLFHGVSQSHLALKSPAWTAFLEETNAIKGIRDRFPLIAHISKDEVDDDDLRSHVIRYINAVAN